MRVVVVVESMFGNTYAVAESIAEGLRANHPSVGVELVRVVDAAPEVVAGADLVAVGAPTHWFGAPSRRTQRQYLKDRDLVAGRTSAGNPIDPAAGGPRVRDWLATLPAAEPERRAAAFDTRLARPLSGGAAPSIARALRDLGYTITTEPTGFVVDAMEGPLRPGELDRARAWGASLLAHLRA
jgi:hypothetical protein